MTTPTIRPGSALEAVTQAIETAMDSQAYADTDTPVVLIAQVAIDAVQEHWQRWMRPTGFGWTLYGPMSDLGKAAIGYYDSPNLKHPVMLVAHIQSDGRLNFSVYAMDNEGNGGYDDPEAIKNALDAIVEGIDS
jgi:hypothetical protein